MSKAGTVARVIFVRLRFIYVFIAVGLVYGNRERIFGFVDRLTRPSKAQDMVTGEFEWYCPMHPTVVRQDDKEKCPICGMPLSRRKKGEKIQLPPGILSRLQLSPHRIRAAGVATEEIGYRTLVREVRTVGTIEYDERRYADLSARVAGRADELFVNFTGVRVKKGDPLYRLYSPDLVTTQEEYLLALRTLEEIRAQGDPAAEARAKRLADSARERLRLWGITDEQMAALDKSRKAETHLTIHSPAAGIVVRKNIHAGHYVQVGEDPYTIADDSFVWVQAEVFERDLGLVKEGQPVEILAEAHPGRPLAGRVAFVAPELAPETRTAKARVEIENSDGRLKPGMFVTALLKVPLGRQGEVFWGC